VSRASAARKQRRAMKAAGVGVMDRVVIEGEAIFAASKGDVNLVDLIGYHVAEALTRLDAAGAALMVQTVVTIGEHPDFPGALTIEAKAAARKPNLATEGDGDAEA